MRVLIASNLLLISFCFAVIGGEIRSLNLKPPSGSGISSSVFHWFAPNSASQYENVVVLLPGLNGDGKPLVQDERWRSFAENHGCGLLGVTFVSDKEDLKSGIGYYYADEGSGLLLLDALEEFNSQNAQLFLYGFSGGAHFVARFAEWRPDLAKGWCAYSAAWWDKPKANLKANENFGLIACGAEDARLGASLLFFKQGRMQGRKWLWIEVAENGHTRSAEVDHFVRNVFTCILSNAIENKSTWIDIDLESSVDAGFMRLHPTITGFMPCETLVPEWRQLNAARD